MRGVLCALVRGLVAKALCGSCARVLCGGLVRSLVRVATLRSKSCAGVLCEGLVPRPCAPQGLVLWAGPCGAQDRAQDFCSGKVLCGPCAAYRFLHEVLCKPCADLFSTYFYQ